MDNRIKEKEEDIWIGDHIKNAGRTYIPINKLGSGSFAVVYMCYDIQSRKLVAMKIFDEDERKSGHKEIQILKKIKSLSIRNCITYHDSFTDDDNDLYCITDLALGSLYDIIKKGGIKTKNEKIKLKKFSFDFVLKVFKNVLESLSDLHKNNLLHGDIKPENILVIARNDFHTKILDKLKGKKENKISKIIKEYNSRMDYETDSDSDSDTESIESNFSGVSYEPKRLELDSDSDSDDSNSNDSNDSNSEVILSRLLLDEKKYQDPVIKLSDMGSVLEDIEQKPRGVQTKYYKSPELLLGLGYDKSCDIWALACTIYELLTGNILFDPDDLEDYYDLDSRRSIVQLIDYYIQKIPDEMKEKSAYKDVFFDSNLNFKSHFSKYDKQKDLNKSELMDKWMDLFRSTDDERILDMYQLLKRMLDIDKTKRINVDDCLNHKLFT